MTPEVWVALIAAGASVTAALIANRSRQHSKAARTQVENNHTTNLREEQDDRHKENAGLLEQIVGAIADVKADVGGMKSDIRGIRRDIGRHSDQLRDLEKTQPRPKTPGRR